MSNLDAFLDDQRERLFTLRRDLHRHPEVGWTEYHTTYVVGQRLESLGFELAVGKAALDGSARLGVPEPRTLSYNEQRARELGVPEAWLARMKGGYTGLAARFDTGRPGPHVALRFDIDALPVQESEDGEHLPCALKFRSEEEGAMHACGHDGHTAIGIGVATFVRRFAEDMGGRFTLLFQPSEEGCRGAIAMVEWGWLDDVDYFLGGHIGMGLQELGAVAARTTGFLSTTKMSVRFRGRAAHAGKEPQEGRNSLLAAASAALHLHAIPHHGEGETRINVGTLTAGTGYNVIADYSEMQIETRGVTQDLDEYMVAEARCIINASAQMHGVEAEIEIVGRGVGADCDQEWTTIVQEACEGSQTVRRIVREEKIGASEDVTLMIERVQQRGGKATYMLFGSPLSAGHHNPAFDYDEETIIVAVETLSRTIKYLCAL